MARKLVKGLSELLLLRHLIRFLAYLRNRRGGGHGKTPTPELSSSDAGHTNLRRRFLISLVIGVTIEMALIAGKSIELPILVATEDAAMDFVMRQFRNIRRDEHTAFVLLEADQETFVEWDEPFYFHRDRVQEMVAFATGFEWQGLDDTSGRPAPEPALVIVDVDLSKTGEGSDALKAYLQRYSKAANPPLILVRTLKQRPSGSSDNLPRERTSFLDTVVGNPPPQNIFWASPHYQLDDDYRIRRWLLWQPARLGANCSELPSVQLLAQVLLSEHQKGTPAERHQELKTKLAAMSPCYKRPNTPEHVAVKIRRGGAEHDINLRDTLISQRLIYSIPYQLPEGELRPKVAGVPVFQSQRATGLSELDREFLAGTVVVIGGTYRETRDWYATPFGEMPGAMIVINAVHSLGAHGPLKPPHPMVKLLIVVLLVLLMTFLFARLSSFLGYLVASAFVLTLLAPLSFLMFRYGVWLDFALPLLAVQIHEFAAEFESIDLKGRKHAGTHLSAEEELSAQSTVKETGSKSGGNNAA